jgi:hypothetical protein
LIDKLPLIEGDFLKLLPIQKEKEGKADIGSYDG